MLLTTWGGGGRGEGLIFKGFYLKIVTMVENVQEVQDSAAQSARANVQHFGNYINFLVKNFGNLTLL